MNNNPQQIWNTLLQNNLVSGNKPEVDAEHIPWYIRFIQGFAGWIAALFFLGFFGVAFNFMFRYPTADIMLTVGILCSVAAYAVIRMQKNDFFDQVGMAFSLCGQLMFGIGLFFLKFEFATAAFVLGVYQLILAYLIPQYAHRLLTTAFGLLAVLFALNSSGFHGLGSAFLAVVFSFIWLRETSWGKKHELWEPVGYGVGLVIIVSSGFLLFGKFILRETIHHKTGWLFEHAGLINSILIALIFLNLVLILLKENKIEWNSKTGILSLCASVLLVLISFKIGGISTGLLVALLGFSRQRIVLIVFGWLSVVSFFSWYYYNLAHTLMFKSVVLMILGVVMLASAVFLSKVYQQTNTEKQSKKLAVHKPGASHIVAAITALAVLVSINLNISKKQDLIENGDVLLFKLAPVDPRSLMQGDYMRLRFALSNDIRDRISLLNPNKPVQVQNGFAVVEKDSNNVVSFVGLYNNQELTVNQYIIPYKYRNYQVYFTTDAFYFQEGKAEQYQQSEYGLFRANKSGEMILMNMVDKGFSIL